MDAPMYRAECEHRLILNDKPKEPTENAVTLRKDRSSKRSRALSHHPESWYLIRKRHHRPGTPDTNHAKSVAVHHITIRRGVYAFLAAALFFGAAAFLAGAFFFAAVFLVEAAGAVLLVTRPDLVLPKTTGALVSTAGACKCERSVQGNLKVGRRTAVGVFRALDTFALVFGLAAAFFGAALVAVAFFAAGFLAGAALVVCGMLVLTGTDDCKRYVQSSWWWSSSLARPWPLKRSLVQASFQPQGRQPLEPSCWGWRASQGQKHLHT